MGDPSVRALEAPLNRLTVAPPVLEDCVRLAPRLRKADRDEIEASTGQTPLDALTTGLAASAQAGGIYHGREPIALFGVVPWPDGVGSPWLLGSDDILTHWREFARRSREELDLLRPPWVRLENHVDVRNEVHVRWLRWLGARFTGPEVHGAAQLPFWRFTIV